MRVLAGLFAYTAVVCLLAGGVILGTLRLIDVVPPLERKVRATPIPPRIADSIERKKPLAIPTAPATPAPVKPVMQETSASLTNPQTFRVRELTLPQKKAKKRREHKPIVAEVPPAPAAQTVSTARSDVPY